MNVASIYALINWSFQIYIYPPFQGLDPCILTHIKITQNNFGSFIYFQS